MSPVEDPASQPTAPTARSIPLSIAVIAIVVLAIYANSLSVPFVFDDESSIIFNPTLRQGWLSRDAWSPPHQGGLTVEGRPFLNATLALNYAWGGASPRGYHAVNVAIHLLAALTLFGILRRTLGGPTLRPRYGARAVPLALTATLLWAAHPVQTQAVTYTIQRAESLLGLCYLLTFYFFIRGAGSNRSALWFTLAVVACALGMATKEIMVSAPVMVLLYDWTFTGGTLLARLQRRRWFYAGLAGTWILLVGEVVASGFNRGGSIGPGVGVGIWQHLQTQFPALVHYLRLAVWPSPLVFEYEPRWVDSFSEIAPAVLLVGTGVSATVIAVWRRSAIGFSSAVACAVLAPTSLLPAPSQLIAEHRLYLPLVSLVTLAVLGGFRAFDRATWGWPNRTRWGLVLVAALTIGFGLLTAARNRDYRTAVRLWRDTVAKRPANALAHYMLGDALGRDADFDGAVQHFREALRLHPDFPLAYQKLGTVQLEHGSAEDAIASFQAAVKLDPGLLLAHNSLGAALARQGRLEEATAEFRAAVTLDPKDADLRFNLASALAQSQPGRAEALAQFEAALRSNPDHAPAHLNLANLLVQMGDYGKALEHYQAAVRLRPDDANSQVSLANVLARLHRPEEAVAAYEAALRLNPDNATAHNNLGSAFFDLGRWREAATHYEAALRLQPDLAEARANLERLRAMNVR